MSRGQVTGLEGCLANVKKIEKAFAEEGAAILKKWGDKTITESKDDFCPIDTGEMKATGDFKLEKEGAIIWVVLYYNTYYASIVHEKPAYHPIGQIGFLRIPFNKGIPILAKDIQNGLGKVIK